MQQYIGRRLLEMIPTVFIVSVLVYAMHRFLPGDTITVLMGEMGGAANADPERIAEILGLHKSGPEGYLAWLGGLIRGDLGISILSRTPIADEIFWRWPVTIGLALFALVLVILIGIPIGVIAALRQETAIDYVLRSLAVLGLSLPGFWIGVMVVTFASVYLGVLPRYDYVAFFDDPLANLRILLLPASILALQYIARIARMMRGTLLEVLRQDYIRTAWAKGLKERVVVTRHALKNSLIPVVTLLGLEFMTMLGGTVVIERIFDLPGIGSYTLRALGFRDYPTVQSVIFLYALVVIGGNLLVDLSYRWLDPRVRYS
ncbi:MAG: ABC transporter permease [Dehalococcoidia bacterium]|nr:ABC transporter permease [Dehalococcoidia bacterium]